MYRINSKKKVKMLLRSEISDFFHCVWNPLEKSGEMLWLNPSREFGEEVEIISDVNKCHSFIPLKLGAALAWPQDGLWTCLGNLGNQIPWQWVPVRTSYGHQLLSCPRARCAQEWWSPALSTLPGKQTVITCNIPVLDLLCRRSREPTELKVLSSASGVKTEQGKRSTSVIAQIYSNSTPASGIVVLEPRGRFLIQHQWIYCIFDLFTRCLILQQLILAFCTWDWFLNNLFPFHIN